MQGAFARAVAVAVALVAATGVACAQGASTMPGAGAVPGAGAPPQPAFRAPIDVYPAVVSARVSVRLPPLTPALLGGAARPPAGLSTRVRITLDAAGAVTSAELVKGSGLSGYDAAVMETLARFQGAAPDSLGVLPMPKDAARVATLATQGMFLDVRPAPAPASGAPSQAPASKEL